jgi:hypothetical protein
LRPLDWDLEGWNDLLCARYTTSSWRETRNNPLLYGIKDGGQCGSGMVGRSSLTRWLSCIWLKKV